MTFVVWPGALAVRPSWRPYPRSGVVPWPRSGVASRPCAPVAPASPWSLAPAAAASLGRTPRPPRWAPAARRSELWPRARPGEPWPRACPGQPWPRSPRLSSLCAAGDLAARSRRSSWSREPCPPRAPAARPPQRALCVPASEPRPRTRRARPGRRAPAARPRRATLGRTRPGRRAPAARPPRRPLASPGRARPGCARPGRLAPAARPPRRPLVARALARAPMSSYASRCLLLWRSCVRGKRHGRAWEVSDEFDPSVGDRWIWLSY